MKASATKKNGILHFYFDGELDEHAARLIRRQTDAFIERYVYGFHGHRLFYRQI